jgi:hypothetical protein
MLPRHDGVDTSTGQWKLLFEENFGFSEPGIHEIPRQRRNAPGPRPLLGRGGAPHLSEKHLLGHLLHSAVEGSPRR